MNHPLLDNPVWHALNLQQAHFAQGGPRVKRALAEIAPFIAMPEGAEPSAEEVAALLTPGESLSFIGAVPAASSRWTIEHHGPLLQMVCDRPIAAAPNAPEIVELSEHDAPAMLALTALVFPGYFRAQTHRMGTYLGVRHGGQLVAMAGERLALDDYCEVSGVCTHTDFLGRGYARHLITRLVNAQVQAGLKPFLHVSPNNARAIALYESLGFTARAELPLQQIRLNA